MRTTAPGQSALLLLDAVDVLTGLAVGYAVIGAMAGAVHGVVRASVDADAVLSTSAGAGPALTKAFEAAGFETEFRRGDADDPIAAVLLVSDGYGNRVDFLIGLRGFEAEAFGRAIGVPLQDRELHVVGVEDFIAMKLYAGGPQDLLDARRARAIAGDTLDLSLLRRLAARYGRSAAEALEQVLHGD